MMFPVESKPELTVISRLPAAVTLTTPSTDCCVSEISPLVLLSIIVPFKLPVPDMVVLNWQLSIKYWSLTRSGLFEEH